LRRWFADFEIEKLSVTPNFSPGIMLAYLMSSVVNVLQRAAFRGENRRSCKKPPSANGRTSGLSKTGPPDGFDTLQNLPQPAQKKIAAGFEVIGRKPIR
jgi:hypothetical protein